MKSQQDIVDLTINDDDDDCLFPTELSEMVNSLKMDGMEVHDPGSHNCAIFLCNANSSELHP